MAEEGFVLEDWAHREVDSTSVEYAAWRGMRRRCSDPTCAKYKDYGGRGITVCDRWNESFDAFLADMGPKPSRRHSLDRKNNDGNYEPGNCRWATGEEQQRNTRRNRLICIDGESRSMAEWAELKGVDRDTVRGRLNLGWSPEEALGVVARASDGGRGRSRLSAATIAEIRALCLGGEKQAAVARRFGIAAPYVSQIMSGRRRTAAGDTTTT